MELKKKSRLSGIELLKLIAMFMIVISHSGPYYGNVCSESYVNLQMATTNIQNLLMVVFVYMGQIGNCLFLVCSTYFLLEQETVSWKKILYFLGDCLFFSVCFLAVFLAAGYHIPSMMILKQFFPTTFEFNWFVGCYLLLYVIHPALNLVIRNLSRERLLLVDLGGFLLYSVVQMVARDSFYYNRLIGFILIYFLMAYSKRYMKNTCRDKRHNLIWLCLSVILILGMILTTNVLGLYVDIFCDRMLYFSIFVNPLMIIMAFSAFYLFKEMQFRNDIISLCASVTLYIYVIHENYLFANYARPQYFEYIYQRFTYKHVAFWALVLAAVCYIVSLFIGLVYQVTLAKVVHKVCDGLEKRLRKVAVKCVAFLEKWN